MMRGSEQIIGKTKEKILGRIIKDENERAAKRNKKVTFQKIKTYYL